MALTDRQRTLLALFLVVVAVALAVLWQVLGTVFFAITVAVETARAAPVIGLKFFLFVFLVYAILLRPDRVRSTALRLTPGQYHDVLLAVHERIRDTLFALYVLQAATAFGTFVVALVLFWAFGYGAAFPLAVIAGILQFVPVIGPSVLIALLAAVEVITGDVRTAAVLTVFGLVFIGFLPDATIRPRLASLTTGMPASLYFVGFVGGTLTVGIMGVIAGPLVVALLVEVVELITETRASAQQQLDDAVTASPSSSESGGSSPVDERGPDTAGANGTDAADVSGSDTADAGGPDPDDDEPVPD